MAAIVLAECGFGVDTELLPCCDATVGGTAVGGTSVGLATFCIGATLIVAGAVSEIGDAVAVGIV